MPNLIDLTGKKYGKLTVTRRAPNYTYENSSFTEVQWYCNCDCGNCDIIVKGRVLRDGLKTSCGCDTKEKLSKIKKKYNTYDLSSNIGIGYASNTGNIFYFDLEDYDKIKKCCWYEIEGYLYTHYPTRTDKISLHKFLIPNAINVDHKDHNGMNNCKSNLRIATYQENAINKGLMSNNTSGYTGVYFNKERNKWCARIGYNYKNITLGYYDCLEDALKARKRGENKYFKEWSYFNSTGQETYK